MLMLLALPSLAVSAHAQSESEECVEPTVPGDSASLEELNSYPEKLQKYKDCTAKAREGESGSAGGEQTNAEAPGGGTTAGEAAPNEGASGETTNGSSPECKEPDEGASMVERSEYSQCLKGDPEQSGGAAGTKSKDGGGGGKSGDKGGLAGMVLGFFKGILQWVWDNTVGWALEQMAEAFKTNVLSLPEVEGRGDLLAFYTGVVEKLRPVILVGILVLGTLMMVRHDNYDLAYAGFSGLPKLMGVAMAMAFLPQFMGQLALITGGITQAFFPGGQDVSAAGQELFKAAVGNMAVTNFLNIILLALAAWVAMMVVIVALLNKILYAILFIVGPFALGASLVPTLSSLAGSWFRGVLACAAIPALWSLELGVGTLAVKSPQAFFGDEATNALGFITESAVTSIGAIIILWVMYKTPFKVIEWAFNVQLPGRGGLMGLAKTAGHLAVAVPVKTAIATTVKNAVSRGAGGAGGSNVGGSKKDGSSGKTKVMSLGSFQQQARKGNKGAPTDAVGDARAKAFDKFTKDKAGRDAFMKGSHAPGIYNGGKQRGKDSYHESNFMGQGKGRNDGGKKSRRGSKDRKDG